MYLRYMELMQMSHLRVMAMSRELATQMSHGRAIEEVTKQDKNVPVPVEVQVLYLYALNMRVLDNLTPFLIRDFKREITKFVEISSPGLLDEIREKKALDDSTKRRLDEIVAKYFEVSKGAQAVPNQG